MSRLPQPLQDIADKLRPLPGLGEKSALRIALTLLKWPEEKTKALGSDILQLRDKIMICSHCAALTDTDPCPICSDPVRNDEQLCIVAEWDSLLAMESSAVYKGKYLVLGGLLAPLDGIQPSFLEIDRLRVILQNRGVQEIILALGTTMEAEVTASYIKTVLEKEFPHIRLCRLAQGIPLGVELKYMDKETLKQSLEFRQIL